MDIINPLGHYAPKPQSKPQRPAQHRGADQLPPPSDKTPTNKTAPDNRVVQAKRLDEQQSRQRNNTPSPVFREYVSTKAMRAIGAYRDTLEQEERERLADMLGFDAYA